MTLYDYCNAFGRLEILEQWDDENNSGISVHGITYGSTKKVWWRCGKGHRWYANVSSRTTYANGCPVCANKIIISGENDLGTVCPDLVGQWHPTKNGGLKPSDIAPSTHRKVWWRCEEGHEWQARVNSRTSGSGCPVCSNRQVICGQNDLATTHPMLKAEWHPTKNANRRPEQFVAGTRQKVWWQCEKGHEWQARICSRTSSQNCGCPVCAGKQVVAGENDLASSFPEIAEQWHPTKNGGITPCNIAPYSNKKVWWKCSLGHEWETSPAVRAKSNSGCPYCTGRKVLVGFNDLATVYPEIAKQWHPSLNGVLTPEMVTSGSCKKVWWQCQDGHVWKTVVNSRTSMQRCGCPVCAGTIKKRR